MVAAVETRRKSWSQKQALAREPKWSEYQLAVFDWVENGEGNLQIGACAGSGKSSLIQGIINRLPSHLKIQVLAFNRHTAEEFKQTHSDGTPKLPTRVGVTTAHSMGNALLARCFEGVATVDNGKYRKIAKPFIAELPLPGNLDKTQAALLRRQWMKFALDLVRGCHSTLCSPDPETLKKLINYYGIETPANWQAILPKISPILDQGEEMAQRRQIIDFGDMLWLPYKWELQPSSKDWLLIDEVQDANRAQLHLYEKCGKYGRVIVVGDSDQAIQGFAFASPKMWGEIKSRFNAQTLPLSVCYRCPSSHLELARYFVPSIEPSPNAKEGDINVIHPAMVPSLVELGDLVLCRFTAPLVTLCFDLIVRGIPAKVRGKDIGVNLARLADIGEGNWPNFVSVISQIMGDEIAKFRGEDKDDRADTTQDNLDCLLAIYGHFGRQCKSLDQFIAKIENLFSDSASPVTLSTIHRSKGDEADRVFILSCNSLPYRREGMIDWQCKQEDNLAYVALTRAKESMVLVPLDKDDDKTRMFAAMPYGGMDVVPVEFSPKPAKSKIEPYKVGDKFEWLGVPGYEITEVIPEGDSYEYKAKFTIPEQHYWQCETYNHSNVKIINTLEV